MPQWRELLARRISARPHHGTTLALAADGRLALSTERHVSLIDVRSAIAAAIATPESHTASFQELFDEVQRQSHAIRPPGVGHQLVDDVGAKLLAWPQYAVLLAAPRAPAAAPLRRLFDVPRTAHTAGPCGIGDALWSLAAPVPPDDVCATNAAPLAAVYDNAPPPLPPPSAAAPPQANATPARDAPPQRATPPRVAPAIQDQLVCMATFNLVAADAQDNPVLDQVHTVRQASFIAFGYRHGAFINRWRGAHSPLGEKLCIWDQWTSCIQVAESSDAIDEPSAKVAAGGAEGSVRVFAVSWLPTAEDDEKLKVELFWNGTDSILFARVASIAFRSSTRREECVFAIAVGNSIAGVRIDQDSEKDETGFKASLSLANDCHCESITSVCFLPDGSVLSASSDGSMTRYLFDWDEGTEPVTSLGAVLTVSNDNDSSLCMRSSPSNMLIFNLLTRPRSKGEIGEPAPAVRRKWFPLNRSTMLSVLAYPIEVGSFAELQNALLAALNKLLRSGKYADVPLSLWDVEIWLLANMDHMADAERIIADNFRHVLELAGLEQSCIVANRMRKIALCIATSLERCVPNFPQRMPDIREQQMLMRTTILAADHFETLKRFSLMIDENEAIKTSDVQVQAIERRRVFVIQELDSFGVCAEEVRSEMDRVQVKVSQFFGWRTAIGAPLTCDICEDEELTSRSASSDRFSCSNGDVFVRCVKSALPCIDCVPRTCQGCGSIARCDFIDLHAPWDMNPNICPLCNCKLLQGRAASHAAY